MLRVIKRSWCIEASAGLGDGSELFLAHGVRSNVFMLIVSINKLEM